MCYADINKWIKTTNITDLKEKTIIDPYDIDYILKDDNNTEIRNLFDIKFQDEARNIINIPNNLKNQFKDEIPYNIYVKNTDDVKYKPINNLWKINFINILSKYLSKIKLGTKWEISKTKNANYNHELLPQDFIQIIKSKNPNNYESGYINISSDDLEEYRNSNLYTFNDIQEDSYFKDSINEIYYHVYLGSYNIDKDNKIDDIIKSKLSEDLEKLKIELNLSIDINATLLNRIKENFTLDTLKEELKNNDITEIQYNNIYQNILNSILPELNNQNIEYLEYYNIIKKILNLVIVNNNFIVKIIKKNINEYRTLTNNIEELDYSDSRIINLMDKIRSELQQESKNKCDYKELRDGLINLITTFKKDNTPENETPTIYEPSFILIDNIDELEGTNSDGSDSLLHLLYYDEDKTISPECNNSRTYSSNPYKYIKNNITEDRCYEEDIINMYDKNGNTNFDNYIRSYINENINYTEINSYYNQHFDEIKSNNDSIADGIYSTKNYNCMINFLENNTQEYNDSGCHDKNKRGENVRQNSIIKDTDFIPSIYIINEILPNYIYYLKSHITDISNNRCLYYYDTIDESSRVTMDKLKDLPDETSLPLTDSNELTIQHKDYGKIGTEFGKYGEIGTEIGKYGLISSNGQNYNNYITNRKCNNIVQNIKDEIDSIKTEKINNIPSIEINTTYIDTLKQNYEVEIEKIDTEISNNNTYFSTTRPYEDYSNIVFTKTDVNTINNGNYIDITTLLRYKIDLEKINGDIDNYKNNETICPDKTNKCRKIIIKSDITNGNTITTFNLYDFYTNTINPDHNRQLNIVVGDYINTQNTNINYKITNIYNDYPVNFQNDFTNFPQEKIYSFYEWIDKNIIITDLTKDYYFKIKDGNTDVYYVLKIDRNNDDTNSPKEENLLYQYINEYNKDTTSASLTDIEQCVGTKFTESDGISKSENPCTINGAECKEIGYRYIEDNFNKISNLDNDRNTWIDNNFITDYNEIYKLSTGQEKRELQNTDANYWINRYKSGKRCLTNDEGVDMIDSQGNYKINPNYNYGLKWYYFTNDENDLPQNSIIINISNKDNIFNNIYNDDDKIDLIDSQEVVEFIDVNGNSIQMDIIDENYYLKLSFDNGTIKYYKVDGSNKCLGSQICSNKTNTNYRDEYNSHINEIIKDNNYCDTLNQNYGIEGNSHYESNDIQKTCYHSFQNTNYHNLTYYPGNYDVSYTLNS